MSDALTLAPDFVFEETVKYKTLISQFENGVEQRRAKRSAAIRSWRLVYNNRLKADFETIKSLAATEVGAYTVFTWTNPNDSTSYNVRFESDEITYLLKAYNIYDFEFTLIEVK